MDAEGKVAGYAAGTEAETSKLASMRWAPNAMPGTAYRALKTRMVQQLQTARALAESDGVMVDGNVWSTDAASQTKYVGILVFVSLNPAYSGSWKSHNNGFVTLDAAGVTGVCYAVMAYLEACFAWERDTLALIDAAATVEDLLAVDMYGGRPAGQGLSSSP
jgi:Domain of unknown function (DUF4376)